MTGNVRRYLRHLMPLVLVFMMLSAGPTNEVSSLVRRILDAAPDEFMRQSYVNGYISRTGYARNE